MRHNTSWLCYCTPPPPTPLPCIALGPPSMEEGRSWSNLRTNPDTCIIPSSSPTMEVRFPGRGGLVRPCCCCCIAFNWILAQILIWSRHKYSSDPSTNPGTCYRMLDALLHFYISRFCPHCFAFGGFDYMVGEAEIEGSPPVIENI